MTRDVRKTVCFAVCVAILLAVLGALAWATSGFKNWDAKTWFNHWGKGSPTVSKPEDPSEPDKPDVPNKPGEPIIDGEKTVYENTIITAEMRSPMRLASARAANSDSFTITATVAADGGGYTSDELQNVTWSIAWNGTDFSWATGTWAENDHDEVTDFVTMTTEHNVATFTLVNIFGTQIKVICKSNIDPTIKASATIDYCAKIKTLKAKWGSSATEQTIFTTSTEDKFEAVPPWLEAQNAGNYPVMPGQVDFHNFDATPGVTGISFVSNIESGVGSYIDSIYNAGSYVEISAAHDFGGILRSTYKHTFDDLQNYVTTYSAIEKTLMYGIFGSSTSMFYSQGNVYYFNNHDKDFLVHLHFVMRSGKTYDIRYYVDVKVPKPNISSLTLDNTSILF